MEIEIEKQSFKGGLKIVLIYLFQDLKKKPRSFKMGILTVFIVIGFVSLLQSVLQLSPLIFLKIAENQVSDIDMIFTPFPSVNRSDSSPSNTSNSSSFSLLESIEKSFLNADKMEKICNNITEIKGCSPRWLFFGDVKKFNSTNKSKKGESVRSFLMILDSLKEKSIGVGRNLIGNSLKQEESYLTYSTIDFLGIDLEKGKL